MGFQLDDRDESNRELRSIISDAKLNHPIEPSKFERLSMIHGRFRSTQANLVSLLDRQEISPEEYFLRFNSALRAAMAENEEVLGHADFVSVFGTAGLEPQGLVDPEVFFSETRKEPPKSRAR